ncbi:MAG: hypothetical protein QM730_22615 [Anaerolineales bacterium]
MKVSKPVALSLLITAILLFLGILFWPFVLNNILKPIALVIWLLLRILVLGFHQKYFWYAAIVGAIVILWRILPKEQTDTPTDSHMEMNTTIINIGYWRSLFIYNGQNIQDEKTLKRELTHLLTSLYASKQSVSNDYRVHEDLQQGNIPLPENIHKFLFPQEPSTSDGTLKKFFKAFQRVPQKWIRQWTGQEKSEHYQMIDEVLNFMEASLEIKK